MHLGASGLESFLDNLDGLSIHALEFWQLEQLVEVFADGSAIGRKVGGGYCCCEPEDPLHETKSCLCAEGHDEGVWRDDTEDDENIFDEDGECANEGRKGESRSLELKLASLFISTVTEQDLFGLPRSRRGQRYRGRLLQK